MGTLFVYLFLIWYEYNVVTPGPFLAGWWVRCHETRGNVRALPHRKTGLEPWDTW
jgi:hypothetical protein